MYVPLVEPLLDELPLVVLPRPPAVPAIVRTALSGSFLLLEPTYTVFVYSLMYQS